MKKIGKAWSSLYHSTCVWGVEVNFKFAEQIGQSQFLPSGSQREHGTDFIFPTYRLSQPYNINSCVNNGPVNRDVNCLLACRC